MFDQSFPASPFDGFLPPDPSGNTNVAASAVGADRSSLNEVELKTVLKCMELALSVYNAPTRKLSAYEVSLKSMLTVIRGRVLDQLVLEQIDTATG